MSWLHKANLLGLGRPLPKIVGIALAVLPFLLLVVAYLVGSEMRLQENPSDKLMPSLAKMWESFNRYAFEADNRTGNYLLLSDWTASMRRMAFGLGLSAVTGLALGLLTGMIPYMRRFLLPFVTFWSIVPPLAILPILFILFGVGETGKVALIFLGTVWFIARDISDYVRNIPTEQFVKSLTCNASMVGIVRHILLPQVMPRLISTVRLSLGAAWLFLIAAEAIAADSGLGYRIFLVRRYLAMDVIIPYVIVITLTGFLLDYGLRKWLAWRYRWYVAMER